MHKSNRILESFAHAVPYPAPTHQDHWWVASHPQTPALRVTSRFGDKPVGRQVVSATGDSATVDSATNQDDWATECLTNYSHFCK